MVPNAAGTSSRVSSIFRPKRNTCSTKLAPPSQAPPRSTLPFKDSLFARAETLVLSFWGIWERGFNMRSPRGRSRRAGLLCQGTCRRRIYGEHRPAAEEFTAKVEKWPFNHQIRETAEQDH